MDDLYGLYQTVDYADHGGLGSSQTLENPISLADFASSYQGLLSSGVFRPIVDVEQLLSAPAMSEASISPEFRGEEVMEGRISAGEVSTSMKAKIAGHPRYPCLLQAYIDCQKVGAPPEIASLFEEIRRETDACNMNAVTSRLGADPELDEFMESYYEVLVKYKSDLSKPLEEATTFLNKIESQLSNLCKGISRLSGSGYVEYFYPKYHFNIFIRWVLTLLCFPADELAGSSEEECSGREIEVQESHPRGEDRELKDKLLRKYSGCLSSLKQEFSKKKKKGKLPKEARKTLLDWWNIHYKWPYPTDTDKIELANLTGLDQKQINNWFINQRKRHWKPSESMQFAVMDSLSAPFYVDN